MRKNLYQPVGISEYEIPLHGVLVHVARFGGWLMCLSPLCCFPSFVSCCCLDRRGLAGDRNKWVRWETSVIRWHKAIIKEQLHAWASVCVVVVIVCAGACIMPCVRSVVINLRVVCLFFFWQTVKQVTAGLVLRNIAALLWTWWFY